MFNLFNREKRAEEHFRVLQTLTEKYRVLFDDIKKRLNEGVDIYLIYFFEKTGDDLSKLAEASGLEVVHNNRSMENADCLNIWSFEQFVSQNVKVGGDVLCAEFYPLRSKNLELLRLLPESGQVFFYTELDNSFFKGLGMERVGMLIERLGMKSNEVIQHSMIDSSIERAQKTAEKRVKNEISASNMSDWVEKNLS